MDWITKINETINCIDSNLKEKDILRLLEQKLFISYSHLQKGFKAITGITITEYFSNRKLYCAAIEIADNKGSISKIAEDYQYDSYDSFYKAFVKFHKCTPKEVRENPEKMHRYPPLKIKVTVKGGDELVYKEITIDSFKIYGQQHVIDFNKRETKELAIIQKAISEKKHEGEDIYSIITDKGSQFLYFIGCINKKLKNDIEAVIQSGTWLVFTCEGKWPDALRDIRDRLFNEFLISHHEYELLGNALVERMPDGDYNSYNYKCELWAPVKHTE